MYLATLFLPYTVLKYPFLQVIGEFGSFRHELPLLLAFLLHLSLMLVDWPSCMSGEWTQKLSLETVWGFSLLFFPPPYPASG